MTTLPKRRAERAKDAPETGLKLVKNARKTALLTTPERPAIACACGCGEQFTPKNNEHRYLDGKHRQRRFVEDKKDATFAFVERLFRVQGGASEATAARIAQDTVDFYFTTRCKALERAGWKYNSKAQAWERKAA